MPQPPTTEVPPRTLVRDDWAYMLPMFTFLGFVYLGGKFPDYYPHTYVGRCVCVAALLIMFWKQYTPIRWNHWWLGLIVGVVGIFQWVGMQLALQKLAPAVFAPEMKIDVLYHIQQLQRTWIPMPGFMQLEANAFNPFRFFDNEWQSYTFIAIRWLIGASLLVPIMEELFWRDYVWRTIIAPNDFKLAKVGEWDWKAFFGVAAVFAVVHGNWWLTSIVWALMISWLLLKTKSIGACIIAHATTNFLLGAYVLYTRDWSFW